MPVETVYEDSTRSEQVVTRRASHPSVGDLRLCHPGHFLERIPRDITFDGVALAVNLRLCTENLNCPGNAKIRQAEGNVLARTTGH